MKSYLKVSHHLQVLEPIFSPYIHFTIRKQQSMSRLYQQFTAQRTHNLNKNIACLPSQKTALSKIYSLENYESCDIVGESP